MQILNIWRTLTVRNTESKFLDGMVAGKHIICQGTKINTSFFIFKLLTHVTFYMHYSNNVTVKEQCLARGAVTLQNPPSFTFLPSVNDSSSPATSPSPPPPIISVSPFTLCLPVILLPKQHTHMQARVHACMHAHTHAHTHTPTNF